ncbi:hypothetical protein HNP84_006523 [Thermocatellispora tengchongensis]|uniref:Uncharacterized protein n=1 Tax=Thermocatellispora tengchongensis TaxID=1073253 RepID=A0A840PBZ6_9ACTN|nr:hypothetical protein [Thermocatellispora tengchongensis]MBB5136772.1 hypothetical protein [Thermocatellispora tengchongensis]
MSSFTFGPSTPVRHGTDENARRTPVSGTCPECGASELAAYRVLSEGGRWDVEKCQACLASAHRTPAPALGPFTPFGSGA